MYFLPRPGAYIWWMVIVCYSDSRIATLSHATAVPARNPSSRTLYYLHTTPAIWRSARDTCARYGAHLVHNEDAAKLEADVFVLDNYLSWNQAFSSLSDSVWSGLYHNTADNVVFWDPCKDYDKSKVPQDVQRVKAQIETTSHVCAAFDSSDLKATVDSCDNLKPYICQIDEGECWFLSVDNTQFVDRSLLPPPPSPTPPPQLPSPTTSPSQTPTYPNTPGECWFLPVDNTQFVDRSLLPPPPSPTPPPQLPSPTTSPSQSPTYPNTPGECWFLPVDNTQFVDSSNAIPSVSTANDCAKKCREEPVDSTGAECWGFTFRHTVGGACHLYVRDTRHAPLQDIYSSLNESLDTSYIKICTGGSVTDMGSRPSGVSGDQTCHGVGSPTDDWVNGVCFCQCDQPPSVRPPSELILTLVEQIDELVERLRVDPANTSAAYRRLNSADDSRTSATSIGTAGVVFMSVCIVAVLVFDMPVLFFHLTACLTRRPESLMAPPQPSSQKYQ